MADYLQKNRNRRKKASEILNPGWLTNDIILRFLSAFYYNGQFENCNNVEKYEVHNNGKYMKYANSFDREQLIQTNYFVFL